MENLGNGRYRIEGPLGQGGMALVLRAHDEELHRPVAVKLLSDAFVDDPSLRGRFVREARLAARLGHPNVVAVFDAGEEDDQPYIVMELVEGRTAADLETPLTPSEVVALGVQACAGLAHAHAAGLVHRDIKPQNLLVRDDGTLKIADFGIAHATEATRLTEIGTILGTAAYLAPETLLGEEVGAPADVYGLGAVLYELLTGRPPHVFTTLPELARQRADEPVTPVRDLVPAVPEPVEDAVMRALARNPRFRPDAAELGRALDGSPASEAPTRRLAVQRPDRRWLLPALAGATLLAVMLAVALTRGGGKPKPVTRPAVPAIARGTTPAAGARSLSAWLRARSR
ncbi:MAG: serine/threonine-protein kinase [Gaiellaceae bacterium]